MAQTKHSGYCFLTILDILQTQDLLELISKVRPDFYLLKCCTPLSPNHINSTGNNNMALTQQVYKSPEETGRTTYVNTSLLYLSVLWFTPSCSTEHCFNVLFPLTWKNTEDFCLERMLKKMFFLESENFLTLEEIQLYLLFCSPVLMLYLSY